MSFTDADLWECEYRNGKQIDVLAYKAIGRVT